MKYSIKETFLKNDSGFSLMELLAGMALFAILSLVFSSVIVDMKTEETNQNLTSEITELEQKIVAALGNSSFCRCNLGGVPDPSNPSVYLRPPVIISTFPSDYVPLTTFAGDTLTGLYSYVNGPGCVPVETLAYEGRRVGPTAGQVVHEPVPGSPESLRRGIQLRNVDKLSEEKIRFDLRIQIYQPNKTRQDRDIVIRKITANVKNVSGNNYQILSCNSISATPDFFGMYSINYDANPDLNTTFDSSPATNPFIINFTPLSVTPALPITVQKRSEFTAFVKGNASFESVGDLLSDTCQVGYFNQLLVYTYLTMEVNTTAGFPADKWVELNSGYVIKPGLDTNNTFAFGVRAVEGQTGITFPTAVVTLQPTTSMQLRLVARTVQYDDSTTADCVQRLRITGTAEVNLRALP